MKVYIIHEICIDLKEHTTRPYLAKVCSSMDCTTQARSELIQEFIAQRTEGTHLTAHLDADFEGNPTITLRHNYDILSMHHFTIEEWIVH